MRQIGVPEGGRACAPSYPDERGGWERASSLPASPLRNGVRTLQTHRLSHITKEELHRAHADGCPVLERHGTMRRERLIVEIGAISAAQILDRPMAGIAAHHRMLPAYAQRAAAN